MTTNLITDNFVDADGTLLSAHTADTGQTWTQHTSFSTAHNVEIRTNRTCGDSGSVDTTDYVYYSSVTPSSANYDVTAVVYSKTTSPIHGAEFGGRFSTVAKTGYMVNIYNGGGLDQVRLVKFVAGVSTTLDIRNLAGTLTAGTTYTIKLQMRGAALTVFVDGVSKIAVTDSDISTAGVPIVGSFGATPTVGYHIESLSVDVATTDAAITWPMFTLAAGATGASLTWPMFTIYGDDGTNNAALTWPMFTVAADGIVGALGSAALTWPMFTAAGIGGPATVADLTWPMFEVAATGTYAPYAALTWPMFEVEATTTNPCAGAVTWPMFEVEATAINSALITADLTWPMFTVEAAGDNTADLTWPMFEVSATGLVGAVGGLDQRWPMFEVAATGSAATIITGICTFPMFQVSGNILVGSIGTAALQMPMFIVSGAGYTGTVGTAAIDWPMFTVMSAAHGPMTGTAALTWPMFIISASSVQSISTVFTTYALNIRNAGLTEYTNFDFNSSTLFKGRILAAGAGGIFELGSQNTDDTSNISATVLTGQNDFGSSLNKRIPRIYVGYKTEGDMEFHTITSQDGTRKYLLSKNGVLGIQQRRVPIGRGPKARYWQFGMANRDGADFLIESLLVYPEKTTRRII